MSDSVSVAKTEVPKGAWLSFLGIWLVTCSAPLNMFKPATIAPEIMQALSIPATSYGWIMSVFSICGLILAIPCAGIIKKVGLRNTFIISGVAVIVGGLVGVFSSGFEVLIVSRILEGVGMGFFGVATPTAIALLFPKDKQSLPIGIYQTWMPIGTVLSMNIGPLLSTNFGWRAIWWFAIVFSIVALVVFLLTWRESLLQTNINESSGSTEEVVKSSMMGAFKNPVVWICSFGMFVFAFTCTGTTSSFWSLFMRTEMGVDAQSAAAITSLCTALGIIGTPTGGIIANKIGRLKPVMLVGWIVVFVFLCFAFTPQSYMIYMILGIVNGLFQGWVPCMLTTATARVSKSEEVGMSMGIFNVFRNAGNIIGGSALAYLTPSLGWAMGSWVLTLPIIVVAVALILFITRKAFK